MPLRSKRAGSLGALALALGLNALGLAACLDAEQAPRPRTVWDLCAAVTACQATGTLEPSSGICSQLLVAQAARERPADTTARVLAQRYRCLESAQGCEELGACLQATAQEQAACDPEGYARCVGDVLVACDHSGLPAQRWDCAAAGLVCGESETGAVCGLAPCDPAADTDRCEGDLILRCDYGRHVWQLMDCQQEHWTACAALDCPVVAPERCGLLAEGNAVCTADGPACETWSFQPRCEGDTLVTCAAEREARRDCRAALPGGRCGPNPYGALDCVPAPGGCSPTDPDPERCEGDVLHLCAWSLPATLDCRALGTDGCVEELDLAGRTVARCHYAEP